MWILLEHLKSVKGKIPTTVSKGAEIIINFDFQPPHTYITIHRVNENSEIVEKSDKNIIKTPIAKGIYFYDTFTSWESPEDSNYSLGSSAYAFVIEIK